MRYILVLLVGILSANGSLALDFLSFDDARLIKEEQKRVNNYVLALGNYEKRENRWQPENSTRLQGQLQRTTWELPSGTDEQQVMDFYLQQIPATAKPLFTCRSRDCGESNNWANDHFRIKQLYGMDEYQFYGAYQLAEGDYLTLYIVRRGNRRVYVHYEILTPAAQ